MGDSAGTVAIPDSLELISSFQEALAYANSQGAVIHASELGDGFQLLKEKDKLIGVPFIIVGIRQNESEYDDEKVYSVVRLVTERGSKVVIVDGGTGINSQVTNLPESVGGILVPGGLRRSDYQYEGKPASTYYLDTAAPLTGAL